MFSSYFSMLHGHVSYINLRFHDEFVSKFCSQISFCMCVRLMPADRWAVLATCGVPHYLVLVKYLLLKAETEVKLKTSIYYAFSLMQFEKLRKKRKTDKNCGGVEVDKPMKYESNE